MSHPIRNVLHFFNAFFYDVKKSTIGNFRHKKQLAFTTRTFGTLTSHKICNKKMWNFKIGTHLL